MTTTIILPITFIILTIPTPNTPSISNIRTPNIHHTPTPMHSTRHTPSIPRSPLMHTTVALPVVPPMPTIVLLLIRMTRRAFGHNRFCEPKLQFCSEGRSSHCWRNTAMAPSRNCTLIA
ncbi:hypothetical protein MATL_G00107050 [Megalops atlanticus]|uniref:Uncharacterized protein n=1 Tax=Megalops atlanticus TaxID=7932 RepID=A0A9D3PZ55_MEGAT|nr:hypothetical protein MATL_G00107050 [Megalops atlanticus]